MPVDISDRVLTYVPYLTRYLVPSMCSLMNPVGLVGTKTEPDCDHPGLAWFATHAIVHQISDLASSVSVLPYHPFHLSLFLSLSLQILQLCTTHSHSHFHSHFYPFSCSSLGPSTSILQARSISLRLVASRATRDSPGSVRGALCPSLLHPFIFLLKPGRYRSAL